MVRSGIDNNNGDDDDTIDLEKNNNDNNNDRGDLNLQLSLTSKPSLTSQTSDGLLQSNLPTLRDNDHDVYGTNTNNSSNSNNKTLDSSSRKKKKETQQQQQQKQKQRDGSSSTRSRRREKPRRSKSPKQQQRSRSPKSRGVPSALSSSITPTASIGSSNNNKSSIASSTSSSKDPTRKRVTISSEMKVVSIESSSIPSESNNNNNIKNQPSSSSSAAAAATSATIDKSPQDDDRLSSVVKLQLPSEFGPSLEPSSRPSTSGGKDEPKFTAPKRSTTFDPDGIVSDHDQLRILLRTVTTSDSFLLAGGIIFTGFIVREIITFCQRDVVADVLYISGAACFFISGIIQLIIDLAWTRSIPIGRYSTSKFWNIVITVLFLTGVFIDMIAFAFWRTGEGDKVEIERTIQWISSHLWLLASIIAIIINWGRSETVEDKLDTIGNGFFFCEAMMNSLARYLTDTDTEGLDSRELNLELAAAIFWTLNAFFYLCGDSFRLRRFNKETQIMSMV